ncbi:MAG: PEP/pyruvate-binding domain-containing protein [Candidatus Saccharimonadales bacterium]|nr:PEP/pyruvate-binding domain-containing protein [Candidatus Saccharimonadales bacterium]
MRIVNLHHPEPIERALVGGKGEFLNRLCRAGFNVPSGYVVTTRVSDITVEIEKLIHEAYETLGSELVAVRSSAAAEDSIEHSWAGQFDTHLNVTKSELIDRIQEIWASSRSDRARNYATKAGIDPNQLSMAVVVQAMAEADIAGVMFTSNPVTGNHDQVVIEAAVGLGEDLVSGQITPDTYFVDKSNYEIIESNLQKDVLNAKQIRQLVQCANKIQSIFGPDLDVEWAITDNMLWLLQARPITGGI